MNADSLRRSSWLLPILIASISLFALLAALIGDGAWDWLAWLLLPSPAAIVLRALLQARAGAADRRSP